MTIYLMKRKMTTTLFQWKESMREGKYYENRRGGEKKEGKLARGDSEERKQWRKAYVWEENAIYCNHSMRKKAQYETGRRDQRLNALMTIWLAGWRGNPSRRRREEKRRPQLWALSQQLSTMKRREEEYIDPSDNNLKPEKQWEEISSVPMKALSPSPSPNQKLCNDCHQRNLLHHGLNEAVTVCKWKKCKYLFWKKQKEGGEKLCDRRKQPVMPSNEAWRRRRLQGEMKMWQARRKAQLD